MDSELQRVQRDVEALALRVRAVENVETPYAQQLVRELRALQAKVEDFTEQGTPPTRRELAHIRESVNDLKAALQLKADADELEALKAESQDNRRMVRSALIGSIFAIVGGIILFIIERAWPK